MSISIADVFVHTTQGYLDQDKAVNIAKAEAAEKVRAEKAAVKKSFSDQAIKMWGNPENIPTIKKMPLIYQSEEMISSNPVGWMNAFQKVYTPPEDTEDISKHPLYSAILNVFNDDKNKSWLSANKYDFKVVTQDVASMKAFITESLEMTQKTDDLTDSQKEALRYASSQASEPEQRAASQVAKTFGMAGEKDVMFTRGNIKKYPELADPFIHATMEMLHEIHDAEKEAGGSGDKDKKTVLWTNGDKDGQSYVEIEVDTRNNDASLGHNDKTISDFLFSPEGQSYLKTLPKLSETEQIKWNTLIESHLQEWMDDRPVLGEGKRGGPKVLNASKVYMALPPLLKEQASNINLNTAMQTWYLTNGAIADSGKDIGGGSVIIGENSEDGPWSNMGITPVESENNGKLAVLLGNKDKNAWYRQNPDALLLNQKIKNRAYEIANNDLFKAPVGVGNEMTVMSMFTHNDTSKFTDEMMVNLLDLLEDKTVELSRDEQIQTLAVLFGVNPKTFIPEPAQGEKAVPLTRSILETAFKTEQEKLLSDTEHKKTREVQTASGKTKKLLIDYGSVFDRPEISPGIVGQVKELYYLVWKDNHSIVNQVFGGTEGDGKELDESESVLKDLIMADPSAVLQDAGSGDYYYINSAGQQIIVEKAAINQMRRELDTAYSVSYEFGRKKALELFLGYTMARSFDDNGRISDKDLDMQLKTFRGDWKSNDMSIRAAIDVALDMVNDQLAIANGLLGDGIEYEVLGPDNKKHITAWGINKMKAAHMWKKMLSYRGEDGTTIKQKQQYQIFDIWHETLPQSAHKIKKEDGTTFKGNELYRITQTQQVDGKDLDPVGINGPMYAYKVGDAWAKVPWNERSEIKFDNLDSSGEVSEITPLLIKKKFVNGKISDVYFNNGKVYYDKELTEELSAAHKQEINQ